MVHRSGLQLEFPRLIVWLSNCRPDATGLTILRRHSNLNLKHPHLIVSRVAVLLEKPLARSGTCRGTLQPRTERRYAPKRQCKLRLIFCATCQLFLSPAPITQAPASNSRESIAVDRRSAPGTDARRPRLGPTRPFAVACERRRASSLRSAACRSSRSVAAHC